MDENERIGDIQAIVITVVSSVEFPSLNKMVTVSVVPVDGDQVISNGVPAVTSGTVLKLKGFWALTRAVNAKMRRVVKNFILALLCVFPPGSPRTLEIKYAMG
jgi:hypothetical protein